MSPTALDVVTVVLRNQVASFNKVSLVPVLNQDDIVSRGLERDYEKKVYLSRRETGQYIRVLKCQFNIYN